MFKYLLLIICFICASCVHSFAQTASVSDGCAPLSVNFLPPSGVSTYFWDFKDGSSANIANPSNTFVTPGDYAVEFRTSQNGNVIGTVNIKVLPKPVPEFTADRTKGCAPIEVTFTNSTVLSPSVTVNSYSWVFEDGGTASGKSVSHTFYNSGNFFVSLQLNTSSPSCNATKQFNNFVTVSNRPFVNFTTNPSPPVSCTAPLNVSFNNISSSPSSTLKYQWDLGNGQTSTATNPPNQNYTVEKNYPVKLIAIDTNLCSDSVQKIVSVGSPKVDLQFPDTLCKDQIDTLFNFSTGNPIWDFGPNGKVTDTYNGTSPIFQFKSGGLQTISLKLVSGSCFTDTTIFIFVESVNPDFALNPTSACEYPALVNFSAISTSASQYEWTFYDNTTSNQKDTSLNFVNPHENIYSKNKLDSFLTKLVVTSKFGCKDSLRKTNFIHPPNALLNSNKVDGCAPLTVTFSDSSTTAESDILVKWEWVFGDGTSEVKNVNTNVSHTYTSTGEYAAYLVVTNKDGCIDTSYAIIIRVGEAITPDFASNKLNVCIGDTLELTDQTVSAIKDSIDTWDYSSESGRLFSCFQDNNASWVFENEVGPQDVTMTVGFNGCYKSVTKSDHIMVNGAVAKIDYLKDCISPLDLHVRDSSINSTANKWDFGDTTFSYLNDLTHTYDTTGNYLLTLRAENIASGCPPNYDTTTIFVRQLEANIIVDTLICQGVATTVDASKSKDVDAVCYKGYTWLFGDTLMRPITTDNGIESVIFEQGMRSKVSLIVFDINGCKDTVEQSVKVYDIEVDYTFSDDTICVPAQVDFTDLTTSDTTISSWEWYFDGKSSSLQNPSNTYTNFSPTDQTTLVITDALGCSETKSKNLKMYEPMSSVSVSDYNICSGTEVDFTASDFTSQGSNLSFKWDFKNGDTSIQQNPSITYLTEGNYNVELNIEEIATGCKNKANLLIRVLDYPIAQFSTPADTSKYLCPNSNILFKDESISNSYLEYHWDFGNNRTSTFQNPGTFYVNNGTYTVEQIVSIPNPFGCADTITKIIQVKGPKGDFETDLGLDTICRSEFVNFTLKDTIDVELFTWDFGDGTSLSNVAPISHQYNFVPNSGVTSAKLIMSNSDSSCAIAISKPINIYEVKADFVRNNGIDTAICFAPYPLQNISKNADTYSWDFGNGTGSTVKDPGRITYDSAGVYDIRLSVESNSLGCKDTIYKRVILFKLPQLTMVGDTICEGNEGEVQIVNANPAWTYNYVTLPKAIITDSSLSYLKSSPKLTTDFYGELIDTNSCTARDTTTIFVINPMNLTDFDTTIVIGDSVNLPVYGNAGLFNFKWTPEMGLSCLDCLPPSVQPLEKITYNLVIEDKIGCFAYDVDYTIDIHPETFIKLPTSFSPNGDGVNDEIRVLGWGIKELLEFKVFNRFGELIFESKQIEKGWDGKFNGKDQAPGVYVYQIKVLTWKEEEKGLEGYINLIR